VTGQGRRTPTFRYVVADVSPGEMGDDAIDALLK
jgi:hypothetical protein